MATARKKASPPSAPAKRGVGKRAVALATPSTGNGKRASKTKVASLAEQVVRSAEGSWRGPFWGVGELGNVYQYDQLGDGWQQNLMFGMHSIRGLPVVEAIRHLHRSAFAQLTPHHYEKDKSKKIIDREDTTPIRTLLFPNNYETGSEFFSNVGDKWVTNGEVLIWGVRNDRNEIGSMHIIPHRTWMPVVDQQSKAIFYDVNQSGELLVPTDATMRIPARDCLHLRWSTPRSPLIGEGPFISAGLAAGMALSLSSSQLAFFRNQRRPSGVLSTEQPLNKTQIQEMRAAFDAQSASINSGGLPILAYGLKFDPMGLSPEVAKVVDTLRMSNEEIARCAGVPPPLIGDLTHSAPGNTTEALMTWWLSISLGGLIERFERGLDRLFGLNSRAGWIDLDPIELLRMELGKRMDALGKGVQNGILTPNEGRARSLENLSPIEGGDGAFMQRQMFPVSLLAEMAAAEVKKAKEPPPPPPPLGAAPPPGDDGAGAPAPAPASEDDDGDEDVARALVNEMIQRVTKELA